MFDRTALLRYEAGCSKLGARVVEPPDDQCWEVTQFAVNDPDRARKARLRRGAWH